MTLICFLFPFLSNVFAGDAEFCQADLNIVESCAVENKGEKEHSKSKHLPNTYGEDLLGEATKASFCAYDGGIQIGMHVYHVLGTNKCNEGRRRVRVQIVRSLCPLLQAERHRVLTRGNWNTVYSRRCFLFIVFAIYVKQPKKWCVWNRKARATPERVYRNVSSCADTLFRCRST